MELALDEKDELWIILQAGSRGVGGRISNYFTQEAKNFAEQNFISYYLPDKNLAYFTSGNMMFGDYIDAMLFAKDFARYNRICVMDNVLRILKQYSPGAKQTKIAINSPTTTRKKKNTVANKYG